MEEYTTISARTWKELDLIAAMTLHDNDYDTLQDKWGNAGWKNMELKSIYNKGR